ncbi:hypothetical protein [Paenibacillus sp. HB172176]|uniref:hypothetical protein n=1 Tax=Paenibacillus sp. HB172176 TaxID=2493690 RepID=UPI00143B24E0|nr:hypothetical protein [Paenibacillus sp. HB172176]
MSKRYGIFIVLALLLLAGCTSSSGNLMDNNTNNVNSPTVQPAATNGATPAEATNSPAPTAAEITTAEHPRDAANAVMTALSENDLDTLNRYIHGEKGILFSPYVAIDTSTAVSFQKDALPGWDDDKVYEWGTLDGSGEPISMTFQNYYQKFVYDQDFLKADEIGWDEIKGSGNTIPNIEDVFPGSFVADYHFNGFDAKNEGMDWESLILVLEEVDGSWYVSAIVHSQWTI